ncbi:hypothetical protein LXO39_22990, partial [Escherichia coli]|nr:hypothetical protein [Escherichia coli]MCE3788790.1 hypothetical protein [Escherichia coli]MCE3793539.1 hypothetical protein [Escherichia coli]MCE3798290.1 hypothetical protein [Escherichia coli]
DGDGSHGSTSKTPSYTKSVSWHHYPLTPAQLDIIHQTAYEAGLYSQKITTEQDATMLKTMQEQGVEIIYPDVAPFKEKALKVYQQFPEWTPGLYDTIQQQLK